MNDAIPADWRDDALFAVDRDGQVVAELGYDTVAGNDDFELGGYPAVNDALHGWLRDDVWLLGSKMYVVVARPVEFDATQRPAGAIVGLKEVNNSASPRTSPSGPARRSRSTRPGSASRAASASRASTRRSSTRSAPTSQEVDDKTYGDGGRSEVRMLTDDLGAMYARLPGDVVDAGRRLRGRRAARRPLAGPMGFLSNADDKDKANVPWLLLVGVVLAAALIGILLTLFEHTMPAARARHAGRAPQGRA